MWISENESVATVDKTGFVQAVSSGETTISVNSAENPAVAASCAVKVNKQSGVDGISADRSISVITDGTTIHILGADSKSLLTVTDIKGAIIYCGTDRTVSLIPGFYIIKIENYISKVAL